MLIASLSLVAFPFITGFYSKDFILESIYGQFYFSGTVVYYIATIGAIFTTLYSVKILYLTFLTNPNGPFIIYITTHESDIFMCLPLIIFIFFNLRFLIEFFYNKYIVNLVLELGSQIIKVIDKGSVELLGPFGLEKGLINLSNSITNLSTGNITSYALYILIGFILYILIPYLNLIDNSLLLLLLLI